MDIILYNIIIGFVALLIGYFFGSIPVGVIIGKVFFHKDPRTEGSGNSGGTNVGRLYGKKAGVAVILLDMLKTAIPFIGVWAILTFTKLNDLVVQNTQNPVWDFRLFYILLTPLGVSLGHCYPLFSGFKGGKTVSAIVGFVVACSWGLTILGAGLFFGTLKAKKYVSLASIIMASVASLVVWVLAIINFIYKLDAMNIIMWGNGSFIKIGFEFASILTTISIILVVRHRANIQRLVKGEERKISWMK